MAEVSLENAPRKAKELFDKGFAALERNNLEFAMDMFSMALEIEPRLLRARKYLRAAQLRKAKAGGSGELAHLLSSLTGLPGLFAVKSQLGKKPQQALKAAEGLLRRDPLNKSFISLFVEAALACEMPEAAIQTLEIAREHYTGDIPLLKQLGKLYLDHGQTREAREVYEALLHMNPSDPVLIKTLKDVTATDTMRRGRWEQDSSFRDKIKDTQEAVLLEQQAKAVKSDRDIEDLIAENQAKVQREPQNINYRRALAELFNRAQRFEEALRTLQEAQETLGRADPQIDRAISDTRLRQFDSQIAALSAAGHPEEAAAQEQAKQSFLFADAEDRVRRYPNDLQFRYELGVLFFERDRLNEAIQELQLAQRNPQRRIRALYYLAMCFQRKGQLDIALEQLEKAASELTLVDDTKKDILYEMGMICEQMGQAAKALGHFKDIYAVDIGYKDIATKIEQAYAAQKAQTS